MTNHPSESAETGSSPKRRSESQNISSRSSSVCASSITLVNKPCIDRGSRVRPPPMEAGFIVARITGRRAGTSAGGSEASSEMMPLSSSSSTEAFPGIGKDVVLDRSSGTRLSSTSADARLISSNRSHRPAYSPSSKAPLHHLKMRLPFLSIIGIVLPKSCSSEVLAEKLMRSTLMPRTLATAHTTAVFPTPGGPCSSNGDLAASEANIREMFMMTPGVHRMGRKGVRSTND
eukprot:2309087-Prymnesium_polylepis.2